MDLNLKTKLLMEPPIKEPEMPSFSRGETPSFEINLTDEGITFDSLDRVIVNFSQGVVNKVKHLTATTSTVIRDPIIYMPFSLFDDYGNIDLVHFKYTDGPKEILTFTLQSSETLEFYPSDLRDPTSFVKVEIDITSTENSETSTVIKKQHSLFVFDSLFRFGVLNNEIPEINENNGVETS